MESVVGASSGRSVWAHHAVYVGGFWGDFKLHKKLLIFPLAGFSADRHSHGSSHRVFICKSEAFEATSLSSLEMEKSESDNESDGFLWISQNSLSTDSNEVKPNLLEKDLRRNMAVVQVRKLDSEGNYSPCVQYLSDLGMEMVEIEGLVRKLPTILEDNIKSGVDYLFDLGLDPLNILKILRRNPRFISSASVKCLQRLVNYLKKLGLDNKQVVKAIYRHPVLFTVSPANVDVTVNYLRELNLSEESIVRIIARCPMILALSFEENVIPKIAYFESINLNVVSLIKKTPEVFGLRINRKLKRVVDFFLDKDYSMEEVQFMLNRYSKIFTLSLEKNLEPKWNYFVYMGYPRDEIVNFPGYFGFSLEKRIKQRFQRMADHGIRCPLNSLLTCADIDFDKLVARRRDSILKQKNLG